LDFDGLLHDKCEYKFDAFVAKAVNINEDDCPERYHCRYKKKKKKEILDGKIDF